MNKTAFLEDDFQLLETIKVENGQLLFKDEHFNRLKTSADYYQFKFNEQILSLTSEQDGVMRLVLNRDGTFETTYRQTVEFENVRISSIIVDSHADFLYHKTSNRPYFQAKHDEIFFNEHNELTEMSCANIVLEINGEWLTPPLSSGLLPCIYRQYLLDTGKCRERILYRNDLLKADKIFCCNSVQGMKEVKVV